MFFFFKFEQQQFVQLLYEQKPEPEIKDENAQENFIEENWKTSYCDYESGYKHMQKQSILIKMLLNVLALNDPII